MVRLIETIILNVLSNEIFLKNKSCFGKLRMRKHKNVLLKQIREYMNSHDGTIITSGEFDRFLQYSKSVEKILGHVTNAQDALSKEGFIDEQINSFANQYSDGKKLSPIDRMELFSFFDFCYSSFDHFCRSLLLSDEQKLTISLLMSKIASLKENSDKKVESIINSTRRVEKGVDELRGEMDELKQLITGNHQITDEATIRRAYSVIVNSLFNGDIDSVVNLLPIIKDKNNDLGLCAEYLIGLLSDYPSSVSFSDIQCKVVDDLLYEDITRRSLYISLLEKDTTLFDKINDRSSELFTIAKKLQRNEHDSFYTICKNETQTGTCYNYSVNSQDYPSHHWLIKRICVIEVLNSNTINASEVVTKALKDDYTFIDSIIISERKATELISRLSRSLDDLKQLYEELAGTKDRVQHLLYSIQKKYYITLLKLSINISIEYAKKTKELLPPIAFDDPDIQMYCLQIDMDGGPVDVEKVIALCNRTNEYWLLNNYLVQRVKTDPSEISTILDNHKYLLNKDVNILLIYAHLINKQQDSTATLNLFAQFEESYRGHLDYWVQRIKLTYNEGSFNEDMLENTIREWKAGKMRATSPESVKLFIQLLIQAKKYSEALEIINDIEKASPLSSELLKAKGFSLIHVGREVDALNSYLAAFGENDADEQAADKILTLCINNSRAVPHNALILAKNSQSSRMLMLAAICCHRSGHYDEAMILLQKAMLYNSGDNDSVFQHYLSFYTAEDHSQAQEYVMVDGNTKVTLMSSDKKEKTICVYKEQIMPHDLYIWCEAEHITLGTAVGMGLLRKKVNDALIIDGANYTIIGIQSLDSFFFNVSMQKMISLGKAKQVNIPIEKTSSPEDIARVLKDAFGHEVQDTQWIDQYKDLMAIPMPFFFSQKYVRLPYLQLICAFIEDPTIVYREVLNPSYEHGDKYVLSSAALVSLYKIGFDKNDSSVSIVVPEALRQTLFDETNKVISENNRAHVASIGVRDDQLFFHESSEQEKQRQMSVAVGQKQFCLQYDSVQNEHDLQIDGIGQFDYKSLFGVSDYDALALAKHEGMVLVTAEPSIVALACVSNSGIISIGIADFLALSKIPTDKLLSYIAKMIEYKFLFPITETVLSSLATYYSEQKSEDRKAEVIQRWTEVLKKPLDDQNYAKLIFNYLGELYLHMCTISDIQNPILVSLLISILEYKRIYSE